MLDHQQTLDCLRALADPTRLALFERLVEGPAPVSELAAPFDMSLTAIGQHLTILENAGIIRSEKTGRVRTCQCVPETLDALEFWLDTRRRQVANQLDQLGDLLDQLHPPVAPAKRRGTTPRGKPA